MSDVRDIAVKYALLLSAPDYSRLLNEADRIADLEAENKKAFKAGYEAGMLIMESPQGWDTWQQAYEMWKKRGEIVPAFSG